MSNPSQLHSRTPSTSKRVSSVPVTHDPSELLHPNSVDSSPIIISRYDKYLKLISAIGRFAENYLKIATANVKLSDQLSKNTLSKDLPNFESSPSGAVPVGGSAKANRIAGEVEMASSPTSPVSANSDEVDLNVFVYSLRRNITSLYNSSVKLENQIKSDIIPQVNKLYDEVESRKKSFEKAANKYLKDVEKSRSTSAQDIRRLGAAISLFNTEPDRMDYKRDPYVLKRTMMNNVVNQVSDENEYVDFLESNEQALKALESQILVILQDRFEHLTEIVENYYSSKTGAFQNVNNVFQAVPTGKEWQSFVAKNSQFLVSSQSTESGDDHELVMAMENASIKSLVKPRTVKHDNRLKRDYEKVHFDYEDDPSTEPILEGNLAKKEGSLKRKYNLYYYVITQAKYLIELPTGSVDTSSPSMVLYLPECQLLAPEKKDAGKFKFGIKGKNNSHMLKVRRRNFFFKASSSDEYQTWYNVVSAVSGLMTSNEESRAADEESDDDEDDASTATPSTPTTTVLEHTSPAATVPVAHSGNAENLAERALPTPPATSGSQP